MFISRVLPVSILMAVSAASVAAQSSPEKNPSVVPSTDVGQLSSSGSADLVSPNLKPELNPPRPLDRIRIEEYRPRLNRSGLPPILVFGPDGPRLNQFGLPILVLGPDGVGRPLGRLQQDDALCLTMRTYKVARDDPQSDSTHRAGYSTCQPATRFQVHTAEERVFRAEP
jgi:hypothetical protein